MIAGGQTPGVTVAVPANPAVLPAPDVPAAAPAPATPTYSANDVYKLMNQSSASSFIEVIDEICGRVREATARARCESNNMNGVAQIFAQKKADPEVAAQSMTRNEVIIFSELTNASGARVSPQPTNWNEYVAYLQKEFRGVNALPAPPVPGAYTSAPAAAPAVPAAPAAGTPLPDYVAKKQVVAEILFASASGIRPSEEAEKIEGETPATDDLFYHPSLHVGCEIFSIDEDEDGEAGPWTWGVDVYLNRTNPKGDSISENEPKHWYIRVGFSFMHHQLVIDPKTVLSIGAGIQLLHWTTGEVLQGSLGKKNLGDGFDGFFNPFDPLLVTVNPRIRLARQLGDSSNWSAFISVEGIAGITPFPQPLETFSKEDKASDPGLKQREDELMLEPTAGVAIGFIYRFSGESKKSDGSQ